MSAMELLNFIYADLLDGLDHQSRKRVQAALEGRIGEHGGIIVDDPDLPEALQGKEAPSWWSPEQSPTENLQTVPDHRNSLRRQ